MKIKVYRIRHTDKTGFCNFDYEVYGDKALSETLFHIQNYYGDLVRASTKVDLHFLELNVFPAN